MRTRPEPPLPRGAAEVVDRTPAPGAPVPPAGTPTSTGTQGTRHIAEIDGLRGVAILLIMAYHIWFRRVSGGVDVFLLLSGFLITWTLVRSVERRGGIRFLAFYARIVRRIFPMALLTLIGVAVASVLWLPQTRWRETLADVTAAAVYRVNWHLAGNAVDYLASRDAASPVQHYWSLAIQAQFYLVWPMVIAAAAWLAVRLAVPLRSLLAMVLGTIFVASIGYSIHRTAVDPVYTYFDTFARLWEFALGGLLLFALPYLRLPRAAAVAAGWLGVLALVTCGMVFRDGDEFPGWAALWPTVAAALIIAGAGSGSPFGADRLLRSRWLAWLGNHSYALYLWHWPVLICYLATTGREAASLRGGAAVIAISFALSVASRWLIEVRLPRSGVGQRSTAGGFALGAACVVAVLATTTLWHGYVSWQRDGYDPRDYPGAAYLAFGGDLPDVPYLPRAADASEDRAPVYDNGCHQGQHASEVIVCEFGPATADRTIAVVGGSHSAHWLPALLELAEPHQWRVVSMTKSSCRFDSDRRASDPQIESSCAEWNEAAIGILTDLRPDAVLTSSTTGNGGRDFTPEGFLTQWRRLDQVGIPVLALRDGPWHDSDVPECVERYGRDAATCGGDRREHGLDIPAEVTRRPDVPDNVRFLDLTDYYCDRDFCPAVIGNVLVYHDAHHLSATYARTLAPFLGAAVQQAMGWPAPPAD